MIDVYVAVLGQLILGASFVVYALKKNGDDRRRNRDAERSEPS